MLVLVSKFALLVIGHIYYTYNWFRPIIQKHPFMLAASVGHVEPLEDLQPADL